MRRGAALAFTGVILLLGAISFVVPDKLKIAGFDTPSAESTHAKRDLHRAFGYDPEPNISVLARSRTAMDSPAGRAALADVVAQIQRDPDVRHVQTPFGPGGNHVLLSKDGRSGLVLVHFREVGEQAAQKPIDRLRKRVHSRTLALKFGGFDVGFIDDNKIIREDLLKVELVAFPLLGLVLIGVFRGLRASALPLAIGGLSVIGTFAIVRLLSQVMPISIFALNLGAALGLGLAVDYGLFLVSRYREEVAEWGVGEQALNLTMFSAGRAVFYSGATVAATCAALLLFPQQVVYSMGFGGMLTAILAAAAALIVVPPLLPRTARTEHSRQVVAAASTEAAASGGWYRFSRWVMRHAVAVAFVSAILILGLGAPATGLHFTFLDANALPPGLESREVADTVNTTFARNLELPITVAIDRSVPPAQAAAIPGKLANLPGAGIVSEVRRAPDGTGMVQVLSRGPPLEDASLNVVKEIRALGLPLQVGGRVADFVDLKDSLASRAPFALAVVTIATLVILFLLTGSAVLPIKTILMNSLTIFGVFGVLALVFQHRALGIASLLSYDGPDAVETATMVVVIGVTLGLATDYSILLLSRVKEEHEAGRSNEEAVATGVQRSGKVISNAALLLALGFLAATIARVYIVQELVFGIAVGVVIDATIVRACLVPALMKILGNINWWVPHSLSLVHSRLDRLVAAAARRASG